MQMVRYILKRLFFSIIVVIVAAFVSFFLVRMVPGSPARALLADNATPEAVAAMEEKLGLDKPIIVQFGIYMANLLKLDLGTSIFLKQPCLDLIMQRVTATLALALTSTVITLLISIPMGIAAAVRKGSIIDVISMLFGMIGQATSPVWMGFLMILLFGVKLGWLPTQGYGTFANLVMPAITLGMGMAAAVVRQTRSSMYGVLQEDYITATYAKGMSRMSVYFKYALRPALLPVITVVGLNLANMLAGSVIVESVFGYPGIGSLMLKAVTLRDYPLLQACLLFCSVMFVVVNFLVDVVYTLVDPRMRLE